MARVCSIAVLDVLKATREMVDALTEKWKAEEHGDKDLVSIIDDAAYGAKEFVSETILNAATTTRDEGDCYTGADFKAEMTTYCSYLVEDAGALVSDFLGYDTDAGTTSQEDNTIDSYTTSYCSYLTALENTVNGNSMPIAAAVERVDSELSLMKERYNFFAWKWDMYHYSLRGFRRNELSLLGRIIIGHHVKKQYCVSNAVGASKFNGDFLRHYNDAVVFINDKQSLNIDDIVEDGDVVTIYHLKRGKE